jgi:hypothetical protein
LANKFLPSVLQTIAYFVSSHGLGHATRSVAVINDIHACRKDIHFLIVSDLPYLFWKKNLDPAILFDTYQLKTDIGLLQTDPLNFNLPKSVGMISQYLSRPVDYYSKLLISMEKYNLCHIVCDISPLGINIANYLGIKKSLVENFTWDWIYKPFIQKHSAFKEICLKLGEIFSTVNLRIQVTPFCEKVKGTVAVKPIHRRFQLEPNCIRKKLNLKNSKRIITVTATGIDLYTNLKEFVKHSPYHFIFCGEHKSAETDKNITLVSTNDSIHFPDLIRASSAVIGKVGYGMTVECWAAKTKFFGIMRENFRESEILKDFITKNQIGEAVTLDQFTSSGWKNHFHEQLKDSKKVIASRENGNRNAAQNIIQIASG